MKRFGRGVFVLRARTVAPLVGPALDGGWIRVAHGRIVALGRRDPPSGRIDLGDAVILPGLVNAHTHLEFSACPQPLDASDGLPGWIARVVALRRGRSDSGASAGVGGAIASGRAESAACGVTALGEIATSAEPDVLAALSTPGPRVRVFRERLGLAGNPADALYSLRRDLRRLTAAGLPAGLSPHAPYSVSEALGRGLLAVAAAAGLPAAMHLAESAAEAELVACGGGPLRDLLESLGAWPEGPPPRLLSVAEWISRLARLPRAIVVHGTFLDHDAVALDRLARHRDRLRVAVCPRTTRLIAGRLPPLEALRAAGVEVAIGTDSRASNPDLSVLAECRLLVDAGLVRPSQALAMATIHGARALGLDRVAGLAVGGRADLVAVVPPAGGGDPLAPVLDPAAMVAATLRGGRLIHGRLPAGISTGRSHRPRVPAAGPRVGA